MSLFTRKVTLISIANNWTVTRWFVLGQLFASVALNKLNAVDAYDFRTPIYTQVSLEL